MEDNDQFSKEGAFFAGIISNLMLTGMATHLIVESRLAAILDILGSPPRTDGIHSPSPEALRGLMEQAAKPHLDRKLAELSDDHPSLVTVVHQMLADFLPDKD